MSLKSELKEIYKSPTPLSRCDLRVTRRFLCSYPAVARLIAVFFIASGVASVAGLLRWQLPLLTWSFAVLCWSAAAYAFWCSCRRPNG